MRLIFFTLLALALATIVGLGSTYVTATRGTDLGTLTIGADPSGVEGDLGDAARSAEPLVCLPRWRHLERAARCKEPHVARTRRVILDAIANP